MLRRIYWGYCTYAPYRAEARVTAELAQFACLPVTSLYSEYFTIQKVFTGFIAEDSTTWPTSWVVYDTDRTNVVVKRPYSMTVQAEVASCLP